MYFCSQIYLNLSEQLVVFCVTWFGDGKLVYLVFPRGVDSCLKAIDCWGFHNILLQFIPAAGNTVVKRITLDSPCTVFWPISRYLEWVFSGHSRNGSETWRQSGLIIRVKVHPYLNHVSTLPSKLQGWQFKLPQSFRIVQILHRIDGFSSSFLYAFQHFDVLSEMW